MDDWELEVNKLNEIHRELQSKPRKKGFQLSPGGILNAYREGDLSFNDACNMLLVEPKTLEAITPKKGVVFKWKKF